MRRLVPEPTGEADGGERTDVERVYEGLELRGGADDPRVSLGMVCSVDGAVSVAGRSAALGGEADRAAFQALRAACDVILVGAGTVRDERYRAPRGTEERQRRRRVKRLAPAPRLAIVSGSLALDEELPVFAAPDHPPLVLTHAAAPPARRRRLEQLAEVVMVGEDRVELARAVAELGRLGLGRILCEGGPRLNGALLADDLVEEVFLTLAPVLVGGDGPRVALGEGSGSARPLTLVEAQLHRDELLLRYRRQRGDALE